MAIPFNVRDAKLKQEDARPNGAVTAYSTGIDLGALTNWGARLADVELLISSPACTELGNGGTLKLSVVSDSALPIDANSTVEAADVLTQTGDAAGDAAAASKRFRFRSGFPRYVGVKMVKSAAGDESGTNLTTELLF